MSFIQKEKCQSPKLCFSSFSEVSVVMRAPNSALHVLFWINLQDSISPFFSAYGSDKHQGGSNLSRLACHMRTTYLGILLK